MIDIGKHRVFNYIEVCRRFCFLFGVKCSVDTVSSVDTDAVELDNKQIRKCSEVFFSFEVVVIRACEKRWKLRRFRFIDTFKENILLVNDEGVVEKIDAAVKDVI